MAETVQFSLLGLDSLLAKLESVKYETKRKGGRASLRRAANVLADKAKQGAERLDDKDTGRSISDNIAVRWNGRLFKRSGDLGFRIGVMHGAVLADGGDLSANAPTPHWRLLEFGTEAMAAAPFMRPALADNISEITGTFITEYEKAIDRAIKRAAKKGESA
ncbi:HK97-gp10 family putative phage morphogenesis protein [Pseudomonas putida]|jgi:HK97 gp10 family phage protein|uniref:HK97-gp10 family putative phage morphogenesis protein n=1 Tax=Pseudomonas putida TaxID=303 RepID=UPI000281E342|nr:HK97-gp10 family putative phage morphogenesis protein [Pseudomonas putida]EMR47044.1 HK97 family phage protein [Pseudomonas putida LS46]